MASDATRRIVALIGAVTLVLSATGPSQAAVTDLTRARLAASYVAAHQNADGSIPSFSAIGGTADAVLAFVAAGRGLTPMRAALKFLRLEVAAGQVRGIGLKAKVALAAEAAGRDAHAFGGHDLIAEIAGRRADSGRYKGAGVIDQALALLAIQAADATLDAPAAAWLIGAQCPDGGWQYDRPYNASTDDAHCHAPGGLDYSSSDTNTTAYAVMALVPAGPVGHDPFGFFAAMRDATYGGWGYTWDYPTTDANSTALVIQAYSAESEPLPSGAREALRHLQYRCGAVAYSWDSGGKRTGRDVGASVGAAPAFAHLAIPFTRPVSGELDPTTCTG